MLWHTEDLLDIFQLSGGCISLITHIMHHFMASRNLIILNSILVECIFKLLVHKKYFYAKHTPWQGTVNSLTCRVFHGSLNSGDFYILKTSNNVTEFAHIGPSMNVVNLTLVGSFFFNPSNFRQRKRLLLCKIMPKERLLEILKLNSSDFSLFSVLFPVWLKHWLRVFQRSPWNSVSIFLVPRPQTNLRGCL